HDLRGLAGVDEVVDDQHAVALSGTDAAYRLGDALDHLERPLRLVVVAHDAHGLDQPQIEFARDDRGGNKPAAGDRHDCLERPGVGQPPGERTGVAVELVPRDREGLLERLLHRVSAAPAYSWSMILFRKPVPTFRDHAHATTLGQLAAPVLTEVENKIEPADEAVVGLVKAHGQLAAEEPGGTVERLIPEGEQAREAGA